MCNCNGCVVGSSVNKRYRNVYCTKNSLSLRNGPALPKLIVCQCVVTEEGNLPSHEMPSLYCQVLLSSGLVVGLVIQ